MRSPTSTSAPVTFRSRGPCSRRSPMPSPGSWMPRSAPQRSIEHAARRDAHDELVNDSSEGFRSGSGRGWLVPAGLAYLEAPQGHPAAIRRGQPHGTRDRRSTTWTSHSSSVTTPTTSSATPPRGSTRRTSTSRARTTSTASCSSRTGTPRCCATWPALLGGGRLGGTGYVSILPVDQGIEHSAAASFAPNPAYMDPKNIIELAIEGGCNGVATTFGVLGLMSRRYAHKIPFMVKLNHNELLTYPNTFDQIMFGSVQQAYDLGAAGVGATIYFGSEESNRQIQEVSEAFEEAHSLGLFTILWCYLRNPGFKVDGVDYHEAGRPDRPGEPHRRDHRAPTSSSRSCRRTTAGTTPCQGLRQDLTARLRRADDRPPDRPRPLAGRELLHGPHRPDQQRWRVQGRERPGGRGSHRGRSTSGRAAWV